MKQSQALLRATRWPGVPDRLLALVAVQLLSAHRYREGLENFTALSAERPDSALALSLAGVFKARLEGPVEEALADLDRAAELDLGLPHFFRGTTLAAFPGCAGRAGTVIADLEFVLAARDHFPPGFMHAVHQALARGYECAGRTRDALAARERVGHDHDLALVTDYLADADHGLRFGPPRLVEPAPGVHVAQGYDFADFAFVTTGAGVVAIDAGSDPRHVEAALRDLRAVTDEPITHVILTHAHFDHVGGLEALGGQVIAQAGFPAELRLQAASPPPLPYLLPRGMDHRKHVVPDRLVSQEETLTVGGVEFGLIPIRGGESSDALLVHLPGRGVVFTGDMCMPYLGAPFFPEGSAEGLFEAIQTVQDLWPGVLVHGHTALTANFTIETFPGLLVALRELHAAILAGIAAGRSLVDLLDLDHLPEGLREHPAAITPYLVLRDGFIQRVHHQATGYWHPDGTGVEHFSAEEWATALDLLGGGSPDAFTTAGVELLDRGEPALALRIIEHGLLRHPRAPALTSLRQRLLLALVERNQFFDPFKFAYYAGLAGLTLTPSG